MDTIKPIEERDITGRQFTSHTDATLDEDGFWRAVVTITDKVQLDRAEWIEEKVEALSIDKDFQNAVETAMKSSLGYIVENVYNKGFAGLVEYRIFERRLKEKDVSSEAKNNQDS